MAKGIVRLDRVRAVYNGHIDSVVYNAGTLQNGFVAKAESLVAGERELRQVTLPVAGDGGLVLIAAPEINTAEALKTDGALGNFDIPAGKAARAYHLEGGDIFSVSYDVLTLIGADPVVGNKVVADAGFKLKEATTAPTEKFVGRVIAVDTIGTATVVGQAGSIARITKLAVIEVEKN